MPKKKSPKRSPRPSENKGKPAGKGRGGRPAKKTGPPRKTAKRVAPKRRPRKAYVEAAPREDGERLQKVLAAAGLGSRRGCEELILEGRVKIDGQVISELGARVDVDTQEIYVDGEALPRPKRVYFAVNKPVGFVCTARDPSGRPRVTDLIPPNQGRVFNVGRLDMSSEGLILLTNDGDLANRLTHPRHGVEKLYHVVVAGSPTSEALDHVRKGVYLDEGRVAFANVKVKTRRKASTVLEVILDEGRNREIRRVLARVGHKVQRLERIAVGPVRLGEMPAGAYRPLTKEEVSALRLATQPKLASKKSPSNKSVASKATANKTSAEPASTARPAKKRPKRKAAPLTVERKPAGRRVIGAEVEEPKADKPRHTPSKGTGTRATKGAGSRTTKGASTGRGKPTTKGASAGRGKPTKRKSSGGPKQKPRGGKR